MSMEKIRFIVERLNEPPFNKGISTLTELDSKSSIDLLDLICEIMIHVDNDNEALLNKESVEGRINRIMQFLVLMKFNIPNDQMEDFQRYLQAGDKEVLQTIIHWSLQKFEALQKRSYLAKYLMPIDIPAEFLGDPLIADLQQRVKDLQSEFKEIHKMSEQVKSSGSKPNELKSEITQLEQEKTQLQNKIQRMKREFKGDEAYFQEMLKVTSSLRKEQEDELRMYERVRTYRQSLDEADVRLNDARRRLSDVKSSSLSTQSPEAIYDKLSKDVRELSEKKENWEIIVTEKEVHLEKLLSWEHSASQALGGGGSLEDEVRYKKDTLRELESNFNSMKERLDAALEKNSKLVVFRQASSMARKKMKEREDEVTTLMDEKNRIKRQVEDKENQLKAQGKNNRVGKMDIKKYGAVVREKIETYKKMREELSALRNEVVILQRTEQILKNRVQNLEDFLKEQERRKGIEGYRDTQRALVEMAEKTAEIDAAKGATLEQISAMVEAIGREFKLKQTQLQPIMNELKSVRQEFMDVESEYLERKSSYDKVAVGLEMEKQAMEKECDTLQDTCLKEESQYHTLTNLISIAKVRLSRAEQEEKWRSNKGELARDFHSLKDAYADKIARQEQQMKVLRKQHKDLKENAGAMTNQKSNFAYLKSLLDAKLCAVNGDIKGLETIQNHLENGRPMPASRASPTSKTASNGGASMMTSSSEPLRRGESYSMGGADVMNFD